MNNENIEKLVTKYWAGETTLAEEQQLREYQSMGLIQDDSTSAILHYMSHIREQSSTRAVELPKETPVLSLWSKYRPMLLSIAAAVTLMIAAFIAWPQSSNENRVITDPQEAIEVTYAALSILNGKIDEGRKSINENLSLVEKTQLNKIL